jgi:guanylate kinase
MTNKGMLLIISGPSGSGKGTVVKQLDKEKGYALSISLTTRTKRNGEIDGKDYFFSTVDEFHKQRENNQLLEHAVFCNNFYGTPRFYVEEQIELGKIVVLEIDVNGALQVKEKFPESVLLFLMPPTLEELSRRLINRKTEDEDSIRGRLKRAVEEIKLIDKYDYLVINDKISDAANDINTIVAAEKLKPSRNLKKVINFKGDE